MTYDLIIKNGLLIDGSGAPRFKGDLAIKDGRIFEISFIVSKEADQIIDAEGFIVSPGFIDTHTHSDFTLLVNPRAESSIRQGVTSEVIGMCGHTCAPISKDRKELLKNSIFGYRPEVEIDWNTFEEYLQRLQSQGVAQNIIPFVGHGAIRIATMGFESRLPTKRELDEMKRLVEEAMKSGAFGLSTGLNYAPGCHSDIDELVELCKVVAEYSGIYATHMRHYGERFREGVEEALEIGRAAGIPVHLAHHRAILGANITTEESLKMIDDARAQGLDVTCDMYPYTWAATTLTSVLPPEVFDGGIGSILEKLSDSKSREKIKEKIGRPTTNLEYYIMKGYWDKFMIMYSTKNPQFMGKTVAEISKMEGKDPRDVILDILADEGMDMYNVFMALQGQTWKDLGAVLTHPTSTVGSDGIALAPYGPLAQVRWHPRAYGTFPRFIEEFVKNRRLLSLEQAVKKITSSAAKRFGLRDRGLLRRGMWADITIFDLKSIRNNATYQQPNIYPDGIEYVIVNGEVVVEDGEHKGVLPGKVLTRILIK